MANPSHEQAPRPVDASTWAATAEHDRPVRVLVQTKPHLVPYHGSPDIGGRLNAMWNLICRHVWQRDYDQFRERSWDYRFQAALDDIECWFLVDHHGPDADPPPDPPVSWYIWSGTELSVCLEVALNSCVAAYLIDIPSVMVHDPLPRSVRRKLRHYPFRRIPLDVLVPLEPVRRTPRVYRSREEEIRVKREMLRETLVCNMAFTEDLVRFARKESGAAEWVRARVPPHIWARLDDPEELVLRRGSEEEHTCIGALDMSEHPGS